MSASWTNDLSKLKKNIFQIWYHILVYKNLRLYMSILIEFVVGSPACVQLLALKAAEGDRVKISCVFRNSNCCLSIIKTFLSKELAQTISDTQRSVKSHTEVYLMLKRSMWWSFEHLCKAWQLPSPAEMKSVTQSHFRGSRPSNAIIGINKVFISKSLMKALQFLPSQLCLHCGCMLPLPHKICISNVGCYFLIKAWKL